MKKASKKTGKKVAKKAPKSRVSFDDVVDSAPAPVAPVSPANSVTEEHWDEVTESPAVAFHQLGAEPENEDGEWERGLIGENGLIEPDLASEPPQEPSMELAGTFSQPAPKPQPQTPSSSKQTTLDERTKPERFTPEWNCFTLSETLRAFKWLYGKSKRKIHLLPEQQGELSRIHGSAEQLLEHLKSIK